MSDNAEVVNSEKMAVDYFLNLKKNYQDQRSQYEYLWDQAMAAVYMEENDLDRVYNGRSRIESPIMKWKVKGIAARINRILFNTEPIGRLEDKNDSATNKDVVELWNKFIFEHQLDEINFKENYKLFNKDKQIFGTAVAKITQEFEEREIDFFDDKNPKSFVIKDNTYFRPMVLKEFYSDVSKYDINDSQACIHSTTMPLEALFEERKRTVKETFELVDQTTEEVIGEEEQSTEVGVYHNLELLQGDGKNLSVEQSDYIENLGLNVTETQKFKKQLKQINKTGNVTIDECYGLYIIDDELIEVICTIASGNILIRLDPTPFKHKRYIRPFIVGRSEPVPNALYGQSNVIAGLNLLQELNASRAQAVDAKTRSISNMWYEDTSKQIKWDRVWKPNGVVKGVGPNGLVPLLNPYLGNITNESSVIIQRDLDQLFSLSPVQEGSSDNRLIPSTKGGTLAIIQQNDMPLNDMIDNAIEEEIKPFIEMLFERNITFKDPSDLLVVWSEKDLEEAKINEDTSMVDLFFDLQIKILGNLELSNEIAHQNGYIQFLNFAQQVPPIAKRLDWQVVADKMLRSFGIKDDGDDIFLDPEIVSQIEQEQAQAEQQALQQGEQQRQALRIEQAEDYTKKVETDTESDIVKMQAEAVVEKTSGQKVQ